jgi:serine/threonine-protein kinase
MPVAESGLPRVAGYEVLRRLGVDTTSDVLLARATGPAGLERVVVLYVLIEPWPEDDEAWRALAREVEGYRRLAHPAVARLYDSIADGGHRIFVLEYVDGLPLHRLRALLKTHGRVLSDQASVYIAWRVFSALAAAHGALDARTGRVRPVVHQDVNPSHVLIPWDGHVKLGNFGISVALERGDRAESGLVQGTYGYLAPEQAKGGIVSSRSDVYSAGLLLWELLAGRKAIVRGPASEASIVDAVARAAFPPLQEVRPDLAKSIVTAVARALEPDPDKRTIDAQSMCDVLRTSGNLEDGRVALVESLSIVRPPAIADMLIEAPVRAKVPSEFWLEPTRKVDVPVYAASQAKTDSDAASPAGSARDSASSGAQGSGPPLLTEPPARGPALGGAPMILRVGMSRPRGPERPAVERPPQANTSAAQPDPEPAPQTLPLPNPVAASAPPANPVAAPAPAPVPAAPPLEKPAPVFVPKTGPVPEPNPSLAASPHAIASAFQPPPPSPLPPVPSLTPVAEMPRRSLSPMLWAVPVSLLVVVAIVLVARQSGKSSGPDARTARQGSSQGAPSPAASIDRSASTTPVRLVPAPTFTMLDATVPDAQPGASDGSGTELRPSTGTLTVGPARPGHRIWIDDRLMGEESPSSYLVPCGKHVVRVGSRGSPQSLDVPCGADVEVK